MARNVGAAVSEGACVAYLALLLLPYVPESARDVNLYYGFTTVNPLLAGGLAVGVLAAFAAARWDGLSPELAAGTALGLGATALLVTLAWAVTARVDVFLAPGWAFPAHRWALLALALFIAAGAGWHTRTVVTGTDRS